MTVTPATTMKLRATLAAALSLGLAAAFGLSGCSSDPRKGYSFKSTYPETVDTVVVPIFENATFSVGLERDVTEALIKEIQRSTPMKVTTGSVADSEISGVITAVEMRRLSLDTRTGYAQELAYTITVDFEWRDRRTGKILTSRRNFQAVDTFVPARPTGERIEIGQYAAAQRLARDLVHEMRAAW